MKTAPFPEMVQSPYQTFYDSSELHKTLQSWLATSLDWKQEIETRINCLQARKYCSQQLFIKRLNMPIIIFFQLQQRTLLASFTYSIKMFLKLF